MVIAVAGEHLAHHFPDSDSHDRLTGRLVGPSGGINILDRREWRAPAIGGASQSVSAHGLHRTSAGHSVRSETGLVSVGTSALGARRHLKGLVLLTRAIACAIGLVWLWSIISGRVLVWETSPGVVWCLVTLLIRCLITIYTRKWNG